MLEIEQITPTFFLCFLAFGDNADDTETWLVENFEEGVDYSYGEFANSLHVMEYHLHFHNIEAAFAFKIKWI